MQHLHDRSIIHRDIKPENILFEGPRSEVVKLTDVGLSTRKEGSESDAPPSRPDHRHRPAAQTTATATAQPPRPQPQPPPSRPYHRPAAALAHRLAASRAPKSPAGARSPHCPAADPS